MREAVSDVLRSRSQHAQSVARPVTASFAVHAAAIAAIVIAPHFLHASKPPVAVMMVTLDAGADGARPAPPVVEPPRPQEPAPPPKRPQIITPPATRPSAMAEPIKKVTAAKPPPPLPEYSHPPSLIPPSPVRAPLRTPPAQGAALEQPSGSPLQGALDVTDFCCPEYLGRVTSAIKQHMALDQTDPGLVKIAFTILRDGTIKDVLIEERSPNELLNSIAESGLRTTKTVPVLPPQFAGTELRFHLTIIFGR